MNFVEAEAEVIGSPLCDPTADNPTPPKPHSKIVHFIRHAEGEHNVAGRKDRKGYLKEEFADAILTEHGISQCRRLNQELREILSQHSAEGEQEEESVFCDAMPEAKEPHPASGIELVVVSPMRRTLSTATISFEHFVSNTDDVISGDEGSAASKPQQGSGSSAPKPSVPFVAVEHIREQTGRHPCDRRLPIAEHEVSFPHVTYEDIEHPDDPLYHHYPDCREPNTAVCDRGRFFFLNWLQHRPESNIAVVTHSAFLRRMFHDVLDVGDSEEEKEHYDNCEMRSYVVHFPSLRVTRVGKEESEGESDEEEEEDAEDGEEIGESDGGVALSSLLSGDGALEGIACGGVGAVTARGAQRLGGPGRGRGRKSRGELRGKRRVRENTSTNTSTAVNTSSNSPSLESNGVGVGGGGHDGII